MFLPLWRTQAPFPAMLSSEIRSGSGNPRWNHFPRHDCGNEHPEEEEEEEPEMMERMARDEISRSKISRCKGSLGHAMMILGDRRRDLCLNFPFAEKSPRSRARGVDAQVLGATMFQAGTLLDPPPALPPPSPILNFSGA